MHRIKSRLGRVKCAASFVHHRAPCFEDLDDLPLVSGRLSGIEIIRRFWQHFGCIVTCAQIVCILTVICLETGMHVASLIGPGTRCRNVSRRDARDQHERKHVRKQLAHARQADIRS